MGWTPRLLKAEVTKAETYDLCKGAHNILSTTNKQAKHTLLVECVVERTAKKINLFGKEYPVNLAGMDLVEWEGVTYKVLGTVTTPRCVEISGERLLMTWIQVYGEAV